jgi:hypothetical protein
MSAIEEYFEIDTNPSKDFHQVHVIDVHLKLKNNTAEDATMQWALTIPSVYSELTQNPTTGTDTLAAFTQKSITGWKLSLSKIAESQRQRVVDANGLSFQLKLKLGDSWIVLPHLQPLF